MLIKLTFLFIIIFSNISFARPVSYPEGWTWMTKNNSQVNTMHIHYSPTFRYSLGYRAEYSKAKEYSIHALHYLSLIHI